MAEEDLQETEEDLQEPAEAETPKPEGWEKVEMDEETQARFNRIYGQMKDAQSTVTTLRQHNTQLAESLDRISERMNAFEDSRATETVAELKAGIKSAAEDGDFERLAELTDRLTTLKAAPPREAEPAPRPQEPEGVLSPAQERELRAWMSEKDEAGNLRRPWITPGHPLQRKAAAYGVAVLEDPANRDKPMGELMAEVDRLMDGEMRGTQPNVLPGGGGARRGKRSRDLSAEEKAVAIKMGIAEDRYKAQLQAMGKL